jgi:hypothetical protein
MTTEGFVSKNGAEGHYHQGTVQSIEGGCPKKVQGFHCSANQPECKLEFPF